MGAKAINEKVIAREREQELKGKLLGDLKEIVLGKGLEKGAKGDMIKAILDFEAKGREQIRLREAKAGEVEKKIKAEIEAKSNDELKVMLGAKGLKLGVSKTERVDRLLAHAKEAGEVERAL